MPTKQDNRIEIALASDQNYFDGLLVTASSIAMHSDVGAVLSYHILDGGIDGDAYNYLVATVKRLHDRSVFNRIDVKRIDLSVFPVYHGSTMAYARIYLPELLPKVDYIIYNDVDFLWFRDIAELWQLRDSRCLLQGVRDKFSVAASYNLEKSFFQRLGVDFNCASYVNTGLIIMNLAGMRREKVAEKAAKFLVDHPDVPLVDQTMYNAVLLGQISLLPDEWQTMSREVENEDFRRRLVIHYAGTGMQPWVRKTGYRYWCISDIDMLWYRFDAEIRGVTVKMELARYYGLCERIFRRLLFFVYTGPCIGYIIKNVLRRMGHMRIAQNRRLLSAVPKDYFVPAENA